MSQELIGIIIAAIALSAILVPGQWALRRDIAALSERIWPDLKACSRASQSLRLKPRLSETRIAGRSVFCFLTLKFKSQLMHRSIFTVVFACVTSLLPGAAQAQDIGFYGGVSGSHARLVTAGPSTVNNTPAIPFLIPFLEGEVPPTISTHMSIVEDIRRAGWKGYAGYNFHRFFGVEAEYTHSVRVQTRITSSTTFPDFIAPGLIPSDTSIKTDLTQNTSGVVLAAVARYPLGGRWEAFSKLGGFLSGTRTRIDSTDSSGGLGGGIGFPVLEGWLGTATELAGTFIGSPPAISSMNLRAAGLQPGAGRVEQNSLTWGLGLTYRLSANLRVRTEWERLDDGLNLVGAGLQLNWNWPSWP